MNKSRACLSERPHLLGGIIMALDWVLGPKKVEVEEPKHGSEKEQGTIEWLEWRKKGLGSSDAPVLMEVSPWKTIFELWAEKVGILKNEFKGNKWTERGKKYEPIVRQKYEDIKNDPFSPITATHSKYPYIRASFDGINMLRRKVIEIKCPGPVDHKTAQNGEVPKKYYPQCQWLLMVAEFDMLDYISYSIEEKDLRIVSVLKNEQYQKDLLGRAQWFWAYVRKGMRHGSR